jgi:hypothetical protein
MWQVFEEFLTRKAPGGKEQAPFLAVLWLHTNHMPHPAMPEFYHVCENTVFSKPFAFVYMYNEHFTKTGSGQTEGEHSTTDTTVCFLRATPTPTVSLLATTSAHSARWTSRSAGCGRC